YIEPFNLISRYVDRRDLHSFPTRRSSDLRFIREMENITVCVAEDIIDKNMLKELIYSIIYEDDFPEELKIRLTHSLSQAQALNLDRKSTRLNSSHVKISYAVFCLKKKI